MPTIHTTQGKDKTQDLLSVNTDTCSNEECVKTQKAIELLRASGKPCNKVCGYCYSYCSLNAYRQSMRPALKRNSIALSSSIIPSSELPTYNSAILRFQAHGDLINVTHLHNLVNIALNNPHVTFGLWTKRTSIVRAFTKQHSIPSNVVMIYSNPIVNRIIKTPPNGFQKVFNAVTVKHTEQHNTPINCDSACVKCRKCYLGSETVIVEQLKSAFGGKKIYDLY